jgi:hypothetical protein
MSDIQRHVTADDPWEDLVVSLLSVNQYSLEKTYRHLDGLRKQGLFLPGNLSRWDQKEIVRRMKAAGYDRGEFMTKLFALRLANLGCFVDEKGVEACFEIVSGNDSKAIESLLLPVNGIGPKVIHNFCALRNIPRRK